MEPFTLRTSRLVLRPFEPADIDDVFDYAGDEEFGRYVPTVPHPYQHRHAEEFVAAAAACDWTCNPHLAVEFGGRVIGGTNFRVDDVQTAGLGYAIGREWWGRELGTETTRAMVGCAFTTYEVAVVWATADARNVASPTGRTVAGGEPRNPQSVTRSASLRGLDRGLTPVARSGRLVQHVITLRWSGPSGRRLCRGERSRACGTCIRGIPRGPRGRIDRACALVTRGHRRRSRLVVGNTP